MKTNTVTPRPDFWLCHSAGCLRGTTCWRSPLVRPAAERQVWTERKPGPDGCEDYEEVK